MPTPVKPRPPRAARTADGTRGVPEAPDIPPGFGHKPTARAGVFRNLHGDLVDAAGVLLDFKATRVASAADEQAILGKAAETPAEMLKWAALNPMLPLGLRIDAAKAAAPYYDRKKPLGVDGGEDPAAPDGPGLPLAALSDLKGLSAKELGMLQVLLLKAGK